MTSSPIGEWSVSDERVHIENLFNQRLNFFLVICTLVVAGVVTAGTRPEKLAMLAFGEFLLVIQGLSLYRSCHKLLLLLQLLHGVEDHPVRLSDQLVKAKPWPMSVRVNHLTGVVLPAGACLFFFLWAVVVVVGA